MIPTRFPSASRRTALANARKTAPAKTKITSGKKTVCADAGPRNHQKGVRDRKIGTRRPASASVQIHKIAKQTSSPTKATHACARPMPTFRGRQAKRTSWTASSPKTRSSKAGRASPCSTHAHQGRRASRRCRPASSSAVRPARIPRETRPRATAATKAAAVPNATFLIHWSACSLQPRFAVMKKKNA